MELNCKQMGECNIYDEVLLPSELSDLGTMSKNSFWHGTISDFETLKTNNQLSSNTLYFMKEN